MYSDTESTVRTTGSTTNTAYSLPQQLELSEWKCEMFGFGSRGMVWRPVKGKEPNWFWRWMQYLVLGNKWVKDSSEKC